MREHPTLNNFSFLATTNPVEQTLNAGDVAGENLEPLNLYYQPGGTPGGNDFLYRQPLEVSTRLEGDLYLVPA